VRQHVGGGGGLELRFGHGIEQSEEPAASPNHRARGGEQERETGGGGSARCRVEDGKRERERAPGTAVGSVDHGVGMALSGTVRGGRTRSQRRRAGKQGRAVGCGAADRWG
jgi:hypothetical protein